AQPARRARDLPIPPQVSVDGQPRDANSSPLGAAQRPNSNEAASVGDPMSAGGPPGRETWREALFNRRMLICVFVGFSSGLPLYLLINLLPAWLRSEGVDLKAIGLFALIGLPYTWKFLWSP